MSLELWDLRAFLFGALAGAICVLGLLMGMKVLMRASHDDLRDKPRARRLQKVWGGFIVIAQFFGAFGVTAYYLHSTPTPAILPLGLGIIISIFVSSAASNAMRQP